MSIDMQAYAFIISRGGQGEYEPDELGDAFLEELHAGKIARPHRIRGSSWGDDGECGAYFFSLPAVVGETLAFYTGMGMAAENDWELAAFHQPPYMELVALPADPLEHFAPDTLI